MGYLAVALVALLALGPTLRVEDDSGNKRSRTPREQFEEIAEKHGATSPDDQYKALLKDYNEGRARYERALRGANTDEELRAVRKNDYVGPENYTHLFQILARLHPKDPVAIDALVWIGSHDPAGPEGQETMKILSRDHVGSDKLGPVCDAVGYLPIEEAETFLRAVAERSSHAEVRSRASLALALILKRWSDNAADLADTASARAKQMTRYFREPVAIRIRRDSRAITEEAERLFERVRETAGNASYQGSRLEEAAGRALHEMRDLAVGQPAPDIIGEDLAGQPMKLSEFRGRVVVVNFWATWCGPCMALVPHERELVKRLAGKPFILVGVNGDEERDKARQAEKREKMTWRSWWDGGKEGATANRWNVRGWPAIYVIDRQGIIRHKWNESPGIEPLEKAIADVSK
jgi:thiol-disulfide isomerase/thioredoxin